MMNPTRLRFLIPLLVAPLFSACGEKSAAAPEPLRPVKTLTVGLEEGAEHLTLPGEVRARHESPLSFRVGGKVTECGVNLGDTVHKGQVLARLEPADYKLAEEGGAAQVSEARTALTFAQSDLTRYKGLYEKKFISAAMLDQKQTAYDSAKARLDSLQSSNAEQSRQVGYTALTADSNGVITGKDCNVGQVVAVGQPVLQFAKTGENEVAVSVPEAELQNFKKAKSFDVTLNATPDKHYMGSLRELAQAADPATRTYAARITISDIDAAVHLGMSATASPKYQGTQSVRLPLSAIVSRDGKPHVWKLDNNGVVHDAAIATGEVEDNRVRVASGLNTGDVIVTAGVNLLREGEKVKLP